MVSPWLYPIHQKRPVSNVQTPGAIARIFSRPFRAIVIRDLTQAKAWVGPGFSLGRRIKKTFGPVRARETRWFTEVNVTRNSTLFLEEASQLDWAIPSVTR